MPDSESQVMTNLRDLHDIARQVPQERVGEMMSREMLAKLAHESASVEAPQPFPSCPLTLIMSDATTLTSIRQSKTFFDKDGPGSGPAVDRHIRRWATSRTSPDVVETRELPERDRAILDLWPITSEHSGDLLLPHLRHLQEAVVAISPDVIQVATAEMHALVASGLLSGNVTANAEAVVASGRDQLSLTDRHLGRLLTLGNAGSWEKIATKSL